MDMLKLTTVDTPVGGLVLGSGIIGDAGAEELLLCDWQCRPDGLSLWQQRLGALGFESTRFDSAGRLQWSDESALLDRAVEQLRAYFAGEQYRIDLPYRDVGRPFGCQVRAALSTIPYGSTISYAALAHRIEAPTAVRAVATACAQNLLSILLPCHRVIRADGSLGNYAGGADAKRLLLQMERQRAPMTLPLRP